MRLVILVFATVIAVAAASPRSSQKIVGGSVTSISDYPYAAALLYSWTGSTTHAQACGGTIVNNRSILSAAHCFIADTVDRWRIRVGSTYANSGGIVHITHAIIIHANYNFRTCDNDIAILHSATEFAYSDYVSATRIAGPAYILPDNEAVWAIGWGATSFGGSNSEDLRNVQVFTVNQSTCSDRYSELGFTVTENMMCSGWLDVGGFDQCQGDSGSPLLHNNVVVGISSWGEGCAQARYPSINSRVSRYTNWIQENA